MNGEKGKVGEISKKTSITKSYKRLESCVVIYDRPRHADHLMRFISNMLENHRSNSL